MQIGGWESRAKSHSKKAPVFYLALGPSPKSQKSQKTWRHPSEEHWDGGHTEVHNEQGETGMAGFVQPGEEKTMDRGIRFLSFYCLMEGKWEKWRQPLLKDAQWKDKLKQSQPTLEAIPAGQKKIVSPSEQFSAGTRPLRGWALSNLRDFQTLLNETPRNLIYLQS